MNFRCHIDVTGFASVLIALLAMFMLPPPIHSSRPVDLARSSHAIEMPDADREDALLITVQRDGKIYFGTTHVSPEELPAMIKEGLKRGAPPEVYLKADARARYRSIAEALDGIRDSGVEKIGILTNHSFNPAADQRTK
jgi:biopolymer transport protein TolR